MGLKLILSNIYKSYNNKEILKDCSYSFSKSAVYVITGPNGSGKSTLLRICALLESPDKGEVQYFEEDKILSHDLSLRRKITLLLPDVGVFNSTVFNNVTYGLKIRGYKKSEIKDKVNETLEFVGLAHKKNQNALTLSTGETKRMGIARAIAIEPEILMLDEPTASVDKENTEIIEKILIQLKQKLNSIIIIATHDKEFAEKVGDFHLLLDEGRIKLI